MERLEHLCKLWSVHMSGRQDLWPDIAKLLSPLVDETGISQLEVAEVTHHKIRLFCHYNKASWRVNLIPSFNGVEVRIDGRDYDSSKTKLAKLFRALL